MEIKVAYLSCLMDTEIKDFYGTYDNIWWGIQFTSVYDSIYKWSINIYPSPPCLTAQECNPDLWFRIPQHIRDKLEHELKNLMLNFLNNEKELDETLEVDGSILI